MLATAPSAHAADPTAMNSGFYVDPDSSAKRWVAANLGDGRAPAIYTSIANTPTARCFGSWGGTVGTATGAYVCAADYWDKLPIHVAHNIYNRDYCGGHSAGGASSPSACANWIATTATAPTASGATPQVVVSVPPPGWAEAPRCSCGSRFRASPTATAASEPALRPDSSGTGSAGSLDGTAPLDAIRTGVAGSPAGSPRESCRDVPP